MRHPVNPPTHHQEHPREPERFAHEALLYAGLDDFVERTAGFLREGFAADEAMLVAVSATKIGCLREELGLSLIHISEPTRPY